MAINKNPYIDTVPFPEKILRFWWEIDPAPPMKELISVKDMKKIESKKLDIRIRSMKMHTELLEMYHNIIKD